MIIYDKMGNEIKKDYETIIMGECLGIAIEKWTDTEYGFQIIVEDDGNWSIFKGEANSFWLKDFLKIVPKAIEYLEDRKFKCNRVLKHNGGMFHCTKKGKHEGAHSFTLPDVDTIIKLS